MCSLHFCKSTTLRRCKAKFKVAHTKLSRYSNTHPLAAAAASWFGSIFGRWIVRSRAQKACVVFCRSARRARRKSWVRSWGHLSVCAVVDARGGGWQRWEVVPGAVVAESSSSWLWRLLLADGLCRYMTLCVVLRYKRGAAYTLTLQNCATRIAEHWKARMKWHLIKLQRWNITAISLADVQRSQIM